MKDINKDEIIFSLDIGTRTVIGVVGTYNNGVFEVIDSEILVHEKRTMYDGQIHDINGVCEIARKVKEKLESRLNVKLNKVAIAAAGRALKTYKAFYEKNIKEDIEISKADIESVEMEALKEAQKQLESNNIDDTKYYCVGYSIVNYFLDGNLIENLEGHKGSKIGVYVLATFLPHVVVDSLYTVMNRIGLEVINITLEPIAAINVAIKKNLRLLNLALVDIGAGTSDIAITKDGTILAYAMAQIAGDEITESIAKEYLLDFDTAENIKIKLNKDELHSFTDIVGVNHSLSSNEILDKIESTIKDLAKEIADKILEYNGKSPSAIFLIGGGSQIPRLDQYIANYLELPKERVVIRNSDILENVINIDENLIGPHSITPLGIAITAIESKYKDFLEIIVNGKKIKLFNSKEIKVKDALILIGYNPRNLIPKMGNSITYYLNGVKKVKKGEFGDPAKIYVNNRVSNLEFKLKNGDDIKVIEATKGNDANIYLFDAIDIERYFTLNGEIRPIITEISLNNQIVNENILLKDGDKILINEIKTIKDAIKTYDINIENIIIYKNGIITNIDDNILKNDVIKIEYENKLINENEREELYTNYLKIYVNGIEKIIEHTKQEFIFVDIFNYIDFDLSKVKGNLILKVNGKNAEFSQTIFNNDNIEIYWD